MTCPGLRVRLKIPLNAINLNLIWSEIRKLPLHFIQMAALERNWPAMRRLTLIVYFISHCWSGANIFISFFIWQDSNLRHECFNALSCALDWRSRPLSYLGLILCIDIPRPLTNDLWIGLFHFKSKGWSGTGTSLRWKWLFKLLLFRYFDTIRSGAVGYAQKAYTWVRTLRCEFEPRIIHFFY